MKRVKQEFAVLVTALLLVAVAADPASAVIWELDCDSGAVFTWQAIVTDSAGNPIPDGEYQMVYCYYEDSLGSNLIGCCTTYATVGSTSKGSQDGKASFSGAAIASLIYAQPIWEDTTKVGHFPKMTTMPDIWLELTFNGEVISPLTLITGVPNSGTTRRIMGDIYTFSGRALIVEPPQASSGMVDLLGNDTVASVGIYRPTTDILPMIIMEVTDTTSDLTVFDTLRDTMVSITGEGAGTFDDLVWSKTGFKFPDLTIQTTAWTGGAASGWVDDGTVVRLNNVDDSVGIGTTIPSEKLEVSGNLRVTGKATVGSGHTNTNTYTFVAGQGNTVSGYASTVGGGRSNTASYFGDGSSMWGHSTVAGGRSNTASADYSVVGGGRGNTASLESSFTAAEGGYVTVCGGLNNYAGNFHASIGGGYENDALSQYATVSGGSQNTAGQEDFNDSAGVGAVVGGGSYNAATGRYSTVGGGESDTSKAVYGGVFSGCSNLAGDDADDTAAYVGGGYNNSATAKLATVGGGYGNTASGDHATVSGGYNNTSLGTIGGGYSNSTGNASATVAGGSENSASAYLSTVSGGGLNSAETGSSVSGGWQNTASGTYCVIGGGRSDTTKAIYGGVFSGYSNLAGDGAADTAAFVGGGYNNSATAKYSSVGGGFQNQASDTFATVSGGSNNSASGYRSTVGGGLMNQANEYASTVSGGELNEANGSSSTVSGGRLNSAGGSASTVSGGYYNQAAGDYSVIPGGRWDTLTSSADYSMAFGRSVYVNSSYRVVLYDGSYSGYFGINRDDHDGGVLYPIHVGDSTTNGNGAYLTAGGAWTDGSSREFKENFQQLDGKDVLNRIGRLPIESWEYKGTSERHIWPCAENFHEQFDIGVLKEDGTRDNKYLAAGDVAGVALAGVKELSGQLRVKTEEIEQLKLKVEQLQTLVETLLAERSAPDADEKELAFGK